MGDDEYDDASPSESEAEISGCSKDIYSASRSASYVHTLETKQTKLEKQKQKIKTRTKRNFFSIPSDERRQH